MTQAPHLPGSVTGRECPVREDTPEHCRATVRAGHIMCDTHWAQVPTDIRSSVWNAWRTWQRTSTPALWDQFLELRQLALDHFTPTPPADLPSTGLTWGELDTAALVLVIAADGSTRMWFGGDRDRAARVLQRVWTDLATRTEPAKDVHP